jgi:hypothetical protein
MSVLRTIEQKIEGLFEGVFGRAFRTHVQPVELARKLTKEMDDHRMVSVSRTYAPNEFTLFLSTGDRNKTADYEPSLVLELQDFLGEHARREGYVLLSPPTVTIDTDKDLPLGHFGIATRMVQTARAERPRRGAEPVLPPPIPELEGDEFARSDDVPLLPDALPLDLGAAAPAAPAAPPTAPPAAPPAPAPAALAVAPPAPSPETMIYVPPAGEEPALPEPAEPEPAHTVVAALVGGGGRQPLVKPASVLGRSRDCDIVVPDHNVSRQHAEIRLEDGLHWLVDLDSTNGTLVNGKKVKRVKLEAGDRIEVGSTELVFERSER